MVLDAAVELDVPTSTDWSVVRASVIAGGERRLEAEAYLSDGYGRRLAIEGHPVGWRRIGNLARVWQPGRLKGIVVSPDRGTPYLAAGQVFEARPTPRRFLALARTRNAETLFVEAGTLLVSRSGRVGRVTVAHSPHLEKIITDDLLRVEPHDGMRGWLYTYMRTDIFRSMVVGRHYGHVIKHIEATHLAGLPIVTVPADVAQWFEARVQRIFGARDTAHAMERGAFDEYAAALGADVLSVGFDAPMTVRAAAAFHGRRRLDAYYHNAVAATILQAAARSADRLDALETLCERLFAPSRFNREFGPNGTSYRSAEELFDLNAPITKRIYAGLVGNREEYILRPGWIVMAISGQIYGLNGAVMLLNEHHRNVFGTHDLMRIVPRDEHVRPGYLLAALGHPTVGRPLVIRYTYGTSIPHLDIVDVRTIPIPRFSREFENKIADELEAVAGLRADADDLENAVTGRAEAILAAFLQGRSDYADALPGDLVVQAEHQ
jgi:type I restriction enzyme, S subunit